MPKIEEWSEKEIAEGCSFKNLVERMYENFLTEAEGGKFAFQNSVKSRDEFEDWQLDFRTELIRALKIKDMLENRKEVQLVKGNPKICWEEATYTIEHFYIKSWMDSLIPILLCVPKELSSSSKFPAMVCAHGHAMQKKNLVGKKKNFIYKGTWAKDFAELGCITISMDQWGWGERGTHFLNKLRFNLELIFEAKFAQLMLIFGRTINGLRFFDAIRQIDYLLTRDDVDAERIGIVGLSLGGSTAAHVAAIDTRVNLAIIAGYLNTFKGSLLDVVRGHCTCMTTPQMLTLGEESDLLSLIAPRPVCFLTGKKDWIFPIQAARQAYSEVEKAYRLVNAEANCELHVNSKGHGWQADPACEFIKKHWFD